MKKRKLNLYVKLGILLVGISFAFVNCDNDIATDNTQMEALSTNKSPYRTAMVTIKQIPDIVSFLNAKSKKSLFLNQSTNKIIGGAIFDTDNVL